LTGSQEQFRRFHFNRPVLSKEKSTNMKTIAIALLALFFLGARTAPIKGSDAPDDLTAKRIVTAVGAGLTTKGLTRTDADVADLHIG
jgi:hypothetical protein